METEEEIQTLIESLPERKRHNANTIQKILSQIAIKTDLSEHTIMTGPRRKNISAARHELFWVAHKMGLSNSEIADFMGMDTSSIIYGVRKIERKTNKQENSNDR